MVDFVDCNKTLTVDPLSVCTSPGLPIDIKSNSITNPTIIKKEGTQIGSWTYRAYCASTDGRINVKALRFKKGFDFQTPQIDLNNVNYFIADPLTKNVAPITNQDPKSDLFKSGAELCLRNKKLVPFYNSYSSGQSNNIQTPGKPMFVMIFNPNTGPTSPNSGYCMKTRDMTGTLNLCGGPSDPLGKSKISFGDSDFSVSGMLSTVNSFGNTYPDFVYFGFTEVLE